MELKLQRIIWLCMALVFMVSCASKPEPPVEPKPAIQEEIPAEEPVEEEIIPEEEVIPDLPDWAISVPVEDGVVYGVGGDMDLQIAQHLSLIDIAWQLSAQVSYVSLKASPVSAEIKEPIVRKLGLQIVKAAMRDVEFFKEYRSNTGEIWVLSRKPMGWVLDVMESVLIVYSEQLDMDVATIGVLAETVSQRLVEERVEDPGIRSLEEIPDLLADILMGRKAMPDREAL